MSAALQPGACIHADMSLRPRGGWKPHGIEEDVILDAQIQMSNDMEKTQEPQMTQRTLSLMDVLAPPGNRWLAELSRRKADLPAGVRIVRFSDADDDPLEDGKCEDAQDKARKAVAA